MPPEPSERTVSKEPSSFTNVQEEAAGAAEGEEEKPIAEMGVPEFQGHCVAYLHRRLKERGLLEKSEEEPDGKPLTPGYKKQLSGELRLHLEAGMRRGRAMEVLDKIVFRWRDRRLDFHVAADDGDELSRRRKRRDEEESHLPKMRKLQ